MGSMSSRPRFPVLEEKYSSLKLLASTGKLTLEMQDGEYVMSYRGNHANHFDVKRPEVCQCIDYLMEKAMKDKHTILSKWWSLIER